MGLIVIAVEPREVDGVIDLLLLEKGSKQVGRDTAFSELARFLWIHSFLLQPCAK